MGKLVAKTRGVIARTMCLVMIFCILPVLPIYAAGGTGVVWEFTSTTEGWTGLSDVSSVGWQEGGSIGGTVVGSTPVILSGENLGVNISNNKIIKLKLKNSTSSTLARIFFITNADATWNDAKYKEFEIVANSDYTEYTIDMSSVAAWTGTLNQLRLDPEQGAGSGSFSVDYIRINAAQIASEWEFTSTTEGWTGAYNVDGVAWQSGGYIGGSITGGDPVMKSGLNLGVDISNKKIIKLKLKNSTSSKLGQIFFITNADETWNEAKYKEFEIVANSDYTEYTIDMSTVAGWTGTLNQLRLDPEQGAASGSFSVDYIRINAAQIASEWEFTSTTEGWTGFSDVSSFGWQSGGSVGGIVVGSNPIIMSAENLGVDISTKKIIKLKLKNSTSSTLARIFFITNADATWNDAKYKEFEIVANSDYTEYTIDMSSVAAWTGTLNQLRLDPEAGAASGSFSVDYIRINAAEIASEWEFTSTTEGWTGFSDVSSFGWQSGGSIGGIVVGSNPIIMSAENLGVDVSNKKIIKLKLKNSTSSTLARIFFITNADETWNDAKYKEFEIVANSDYTEYTIDMSSIAAWTGTLNQLRLDPEAGAASGSFSIDYIRIQGTNIGIVKGDWEYTSITENWTGLSDVSDFGWQTGGYIGATITGKAPIILSAENLGVDISNNKIIKLKLKNSTTSTLGRIYFITNVDGTWNDAKHKDIAIMANSDYTEYTIDMSAVAGWTGTLNQLRLDPEHGAASGSFSIDYIRIYAAGIVGDWEYTSTIEDWTSLSDITDFGWKSEGYIGGTIVGGSPVILSAAYLGVDISNNKIIKLKLKNSTTSTLGRIYFVTDVDSIWNDVKHKDFAIVANSDFTEYTIDMSAVAGWTGTLNQLRLDPEQGASTGSFGVDFVRIQPTKIGVGKRTVAYYVFWHNNIPWEYASTAESWTTSKDVSGFGWQTGGYVGGTITGSNPQILSAENLAKPITNFPYIRVRLKNSTTSTTGQIFFITDADGTWNTAKHKDFTIAANSDYTEYTIDMSTVAGWTGNLKQLRLHPEQGVSSGSFSVDYIRIEDGFTYKSDKIQYDKMTHIIHAFLEVNVDGTLNVPDKYLEPNLITSAHAAGVKVITSVNGPTEILRAIAANSSLRTIFAASLESFIRTNGYDGVDIDWEYPQDAKDRTNYTLLMQAIRSKFDSSAAPAPSWSTSMAVSGVDYWGQWMNYAAIDPSITFYNLMAYDMHGPWSSYSGHNSALYPGTEQDPNYSVQGYMNYLLLTRGISAAKVNLGVPSYGWKFNDLENLYDSCGGQCTNVEPVYYNKDIPQLIGNGWTRYWDSASSVPYLRKDSGTGFITYDDPTSIGDKVTYALNTRGAGGVFMWEISLDYNRTSQPLMEAMYTAAAGEDSVVQVDKTAPTTIDDAQMNWVNKDVTVTLNATDSGSGIDTTYYKVDNAAQKTGTSVDITAEGEHTLIYWSIDKAGNIEDQHTATVKIDKTAPISVASVSPAIPNGSNGWYTSDVTLSLAASDPLSGVAITEYQVNNGVWITYNGSIPAFGEGIYKIGYRSTDQAGNVEELQTMDVKVKKNTDSVPSRDNGSYNSVTPSPSPTSSPASTVRQGQIVDDNILNQAQTGKVTVLMEKGNEELYLPINSAELLGNNKLEIMADGVLIRIPSGVLAQLAALLGREASIEDQIVLKIEKLNASTTTDMVKKGGDKNTAVKAGNGVYQFKLAVVDSNSKEYVLDVFNTPIEVELHYSGESVNADLLGIYYYNEASGQWDYVGGTVNKEQKTITVQLKHLSQYAVLEYNKTFDDVPSSHWVNNALKVLAAKHVITGLTDTTFVPQVETTRAEFVAMLTRLFGLKAKGPSVFTDVDSSKWYADAVIAAYEAKLVEGKTATTFSPNEKVSREEMTVMLVRAYEYKTGKDATKATKADNPFVDSDLISAWAVEYVQVAFTEELIKGTGDNRFNPAGSATRAEVAQAIYNLSNRFQGTNLQNGLQ